MNTSTDGKRQRRGRNDRSTSGDERAGGNNGAGANNFTGRQSPDGEVDLRFDDKGRVIRASIGGSTHPQNPLNSSIKKTPHNNNNSTAKSNAVVNLASDEDDDEFDNDLNARQRGSSGSGTRGVGGKDAGSKSASKQRRGRRDRDSISSMDGINEPVHNVNQISPYEPRSISKLPKPTEKEDNP